MASEHTSADDGPAPDPFEAELVAYLDGELDGTEARQVEARLANDPGARARAAELKKSFDLLDYLPRPEPSPTFTTRTIDKLPAVSAGPVAPASKPEHETPSEGAAVLAHENVLIRMSDSTLKPPVPFGALPTEAYFEPFYKLSHHFNGEGIQMIHRPAAHTDGDSIVWFRGSDVISAGDIFTTTAYPVIDIARGGSINGVLDSLNYLLDLAFSEFRTEGGTIIVPGHGRLSDSADVAYYRDMVTAIRDRIQDMIRKGWTLDQVKAAKPTKDYDPRYGSDTGSWTTAMFVEAVYRSLKEK